MATYSTVNTGGGGGGSSCGPGPSNLSGAGGSGVVIIRVPKSQYSGTSSGFPTITDVGSYKVLTFTGDGSYTG